MDTVNETETPIQSVAKDFRPWVVYLVCLSVSLFFMFFYGLNSPIHTFNPHCDYQWFTTMGHGILAGKVPYRDLFEQKGPIVYAVFAVACLFPNSQFVVWCLEILSVSLFLFFCYRIARKFLSLWLSLAVVPLMMMVLSTNLARGLEGSCVEEFCFPIFAYGLLCFLDFIMDNKVVTWQRDLALGICMGILFWVKFTMLEFFLVPLIIWFVINAKNRELKVVLRGCGVMLGGFVLVAIPVIICFAALGALDDLFNVYFLVNIGNYNGNTQTDNSVSYVNPMKNFGLSFLLGPYYIIVLIWGLICFAVHNWKRRSGKLLLIAALSTWFMIGFFCGYFYYYLPMHAYAVLGVIYALKVVSSMLQVVEITIQRRMLKIVGTVIIVVISFFAALPMVTNRVEINRPREAYAQLVVADMIAEYNKTAEKPATMFCYLMADCGFYNAAGIVPNVRYYAENCFAKEDFPEMFDSFQQTISNKLCDFVITYRHKYDLNRKFLEQYYHPYVENDVRSSTLPFNFFEPNGYGESDIIVLFRNE